MVRDMCCRVNSEEEGFPATLSHIRPSVALNEGIPHSGSAGGNRGKSLAIGCDPKCVVQVSIQTTATYQMVVCALFLDDTSIQYDDTINPFKRRDSMRNKHNRLIGKVPGQIRKNPLFGRCIEG